MPGVPRELIEHSLNVDPKATLKRQHLRRFADDRRDAIKKELAKLLATGFIREVFHPEWLRQPRPRPQEELERVEDVRQLH
jgi:predicted thioredoxin/glutaredoxin